MSISLPLLLLASNYLLAPFIPNYRLPAQEHQLCGDWPALPKGLIPLQGKPAVKMLQVMEQKPVVANVVVQVAPPAQAIARVMQTDWHKA